MRQKFSVVVDELDYSGPLTKPQTFTVSAPTIDQCWELAENEANVLCYEFGKVREYTLSIVGDSK